jgi:D-alanine-D-alanine ligase
MKKLRVAVLMLKDLVPPESIEGLSDKEIAPWKTEYDVLTALEELGHEAWAVGVSDDLGAVRQACAEREPHVVFNLLEEFHGIRIYVPYVLGYLELLRQPYTGCNPRGLVLTHNKALANRILRSHRIRVPDSTVFPRERRVRRPHRLKFPLFVKSATEHGSEGIAHASIVHDDEELKDRVEFVHDQLGTDAVAEQYIVGREFYVGVIGNCRLQTFPVWELRLKNLAKRAPKIATSKVKWDLEYQKQSGVITQRATHLSSEVQTQMQRICKRVYRILEQSGYARMDLRLTPGGEIYLLESNPNPQLEYGEDFAESAESVGVTYEHLIQRILNLGLRYQAGWKE